MNSINHLSGWVSHPGQKEASTAQKVLQSDPGQTVLQYLPLEGAAQAATLSQGTAVIARREFQRIANTVGVSIEELGRLHKSYKPLSEVISFRRLANYQAYIGSEIGEEEFFTLLRYASTESRQLALQKLMELGIEGDIITFLLREGRPEEQNVEVISPHDCIYLDYSGLKFALKPTDFPEFSLSTLEFLHQKDKANTLSEAPDLNQKAERLRTATKDLFQVEKQLPKWAFYAKTWVVAIAVVAIAIDLLSLVGVAVNSMILITIGLSVPFALLGVLLIGLGIFACLGIDPVEMERNLQERNRLRPEVKQLETELKEQFSKMREVFQDPTIQAMPRKLTSDIHAKRELIAWVAFFQKLES